MSKPKVDWNDKSSVIAYAKTGGCKIPQVVLKHPDRANYNITFKERTDRYKPEWVVETINPE